MIVVISEEQDISTDNFIEWCNYKKVDVIRLNKEDSSNLTKTIYLNNTQFEVVFTFKKKQVNLSDITSTWFRRGVLNHYSNYELNITTRGDLTNKFLINENLTLTNFIHFSLKNKRHIGDPELYNSNKLIALSIAKSVGLNIPSTLLTEHITDVKSTFKNQVITKPIQDSLLIETAGFKFAPTIQIMKSDEYLYDRFYYSKLQERIEKKYELRVFFIGNTFFAAAIFSTNKINNKIYDGAPPRIVPFNLPSEIKEKLITFNAKLGFDSGSFDFIIDNKNNFYFLEINPVGQFDYISKLCNYKLDLQILNHLIKN